MLGDPLGKCTVTPRSGKAKLAPPAYTDSTAYLKGAYGLFTDDAKGGTDRRGDYACLYTALTRPGALAELARAHRSTLVFVNTRRLVERVTLHLAERLGLLCLRDRGVDRDGPLPEVYRQWGYLG